MVTDFTGSESSGVDMMRLLLIHRHEQFIRVFGSSIMMNALYQISFGFGL